MPPLPASFTYRRIVGPSETSQDPSERLYLLLASTAQKVGTLSISASGSLAVTGLGFQPDVIVLTAARKSQPGYLPASAPCQYVVGCASADAQWTYGINVRHGTNPENLTRWREDACFVFIQAGGFGVIVERIRASLDSLDADGFTLDVENFSLDAALTVGYLALQGTFKVGTAAIPTSTGTQELSGIGFTPKAVWLASAPGHETLSLVDPVYDRRGWDVMNGFASVDGAQVMWGGAKRSGIPNWSSSIWKEQAFFLGLPFATRAEADLDAWLPDSFRLNWTTVDGVANYRYGYLAADEGEAGSFQIRSDGVDPVDVEVPTRITPEAMLSTSTGMYGLSGSVVEVVPDTHMIQGHGYLGLGANEPWVVEHDTSHSYAIPATMDEICSGLAQSSGGPSGGGYPTCKATLRAYQQGYSYWHDSPSGSTDTTLTGQAFDVWLARQPLLIPSLNARWDAKRQATTTRMLVNPSGL